MFVVGYAKVGGQRLRVNLLIKSLELHLLFLRYVAEPFRERSRLPNERLVLPDDVSDSRVLDLLHASDLFDRVKESGRVSPHSADKDCSLRLILSRSQLFDMLISQGDRFLDEAVLVVLEGQLAVRHMVSIRARDEDHVNVAGGAQLLCVGGDAYTGIAVCSDRHSGATELESFARDIAKVSDSEFVGEEAECWDVGDLDDFPASDDAYTEDA